MSEIGEVRDELLIKVAEDDEGMNISEFLWSRPFSNSFKFGRVHSDNTVLYYHSEEVDLFFVKGALGGFEK